MATKEFTLDNALGYRLSITALAVKSALRRTLLAARLDITPEQWIILCRIWEQEGRTQREVAECAVKDMASITRLVDSLEAKGLLVRQRDPADRRTYRLFLTDQGRAVRDKGLPILIAFAEEVFYGGLSPQEADDMLRMLNIVYERVQRMASNRP